MGPVTVYDSLGMSRGLFMFLFILIALGSFVFATIWEKKINKVNEHPEKPYFKKYYAGLVVTFVIAVILIFLPDWKTDISDTAAEYAETKAGEITYMSADELAFKLMHEYSDIEIIDVRDAGTFKKNNIPTAINIPLAEMTDKEWYDYIRKNVKTLIFYSGNNKDAQKAYFIAKQYGHQWNAVLDGGFNNFAATILNFQGGDAASINTIQGKWDYRFRTRARQEMIELKKKAANKNKPKKKKTVRVVGGC
jgi:rhodanese-related sulfurtransferase